MRISKKVLCAGAVIIFGTALQANAQTSAGKIRACVLPSGNARIVASTESCKSNETMVEWNVAGAQGPQGPQGPEGPAGAAGSGGGGPHVVNASGGDVGLLLDRSAALLTLPSGRKSYVQLRAGRSEFGGMSMTQYYLAANCAGDPYVSWNTFDELVPETVVVNTGAFAIVPGTVASRTVVSKKVFSDAGLGTCQVASGTFATSRFEFYLPSQLNLFYPLSVQ